MLHWRSEGAQRLQASVGEEGVSLPFGRSFPEPALCGARRGARGCLDTEDRLSCAVADGAAAGLGSVFAGTSSGADLAGAGSAPARCGARADGAVVGSRDSVDVVRPTELEERGDADGADASSDANATTPSATPTASTPPT